MNILINSFNKTPNFAYMFIKATSTLSIPRLGTLIFLALIGVIYYE